MRRLLLTLLWPLMAGAVLVAQTPTWPREIEQPNAPKPAPASSHVMEMVGEYESASGAHLYVLERDGQLWTIVDRGQARRWSEIGPRPIAVRYEGGFATGRVAGLLFPDGVSYTRLQVGPEVGGQLRIAPVRPVADALKESLAGTPPKEAGTFLPSDLVELVTLDPTITLDVRYATTNNFVGAVFYAQARAFLQRPAAEAVVRVQHALKPLGYGLRVHDGSYRPWYVTRTFWEVTPPDKKGLVADPAQGSKHNRGAAVDLTLYDLKTGAVIEMPSTHTATK